jgi:hypothetical protein
MIFVCLQGQGTFLIALVESKEVKDSQYTKWSYESSKTVRIKRIVVMGVCFQGLSNSSDKTKGPRVLENLAQVVHCDSMHATHL